MNSNDYKVNLRLIMPNLSCFETKDKLKIDLTLLDIG